MLRRATRADGRQARLGQDPPERPLGDDDALALGDEFGEMCSVDPGVRRRGQLDEPVTGGVGESIGRCPAPVAVGEQHRPVAVTDEQPTDLPGRQLQDLGGLFDRQATVHDMLEHVRSMLGPCVGRSLSVLRFHGPEADKVAGRLARTESLAGDKQGDTQGDTQGGSP